MTLLSATDCSWPDAVHSDNVMRVSDRRQISDSVKLKHSEQILNSLLLYDFFFLLMLIAFEVPAAWAAWRATYTTFHLFFALCTLLDSMKWVQADPGLNFKKKDERDWFFWSCLALFVCPITRKYAHAIKPLALIRSFWIVVAGEFCFKIKYKKALYALILLACCEWETCYSLFNPKYPHHGTLWC